MSSDSDHSSRDNKVVGRKASADTADVAQLATMPAATRPEAEPQSEPQSGKRARPPAPVTASSQSRAPSQSRASAQSRTSAGTRTPAVPQPRIRSRAVKVADPIARLLRAGHPWIFREALPRELEGLPPGTVVPVLDDRGHTLGWGLTEPEGAVAVRMLALTPTLDWNREEIQRRVQRAKAYREQCIEPANLSACRVVHGEADGLPGVGVDRLGDYLLIYKYSRCSERYLDDLVASLEAAWSPRAIYLQDRLRALTAEERRGGATQLTGRSAPPDFEIEEDGLHFLVDVTAPVSPGLFLDLREGRRLCERHARGKRVLNLFSFTGAFALRAVRGGAESVCNVDAAARSHARCRQNLAASGLDSEACDVVTGDCFKHLERFRQRARQFDFVVVDPPPFSNVKGAVFSALKDWSRLMEAVAPVVAPGGHVFAVCNASRVSDDEFHLALGEGCHAAGREGRLVGQTGLPPDFPLLPAFGEGRYLKAQLVYLR